MSLKEPRTWPSTRIRGEPEPSKLVPPRSTKVGAAPGLPEVWLTDRPATAPDKACAGLDKVLVLMFLLYLGNGVGYFCAQLFAAISGYNNFLEHF